MELWNAFSADYVIWHDYLTRLTGKDWRLTALFPPWKGHGKGGAFGHKGKSLTTHLLVDRRGLPVNVRVTPDNANELQQVLPMLKEVRPPKRSILEADKGYDSKPFRYKLGWLLGMGSVIPRRNFMNEAPQKPPNIYRWRVEQAHVHRHLSCRRTAVCYDKSIFSCSAFVICSCIWMLLLKLV
jgi:transposase